METQNTTSEKIIETKVADAAGAVKNGTPNESYAFESIKDALDNMEKIVADNGTSDPISKEEISRCVGKKINTLGMYFSTWVQYGLLEVVRGKGYKPTGLFVKYNEKTYPHHEREAMLDMFKNVPLYSKIIDNLNTQILPPEEKFQNVLKAAPYNVNPNTAKIAAKIFFENIRFLGLLERNNKFSYSSNVARTPISSKDEENGGGKSDPTKGGNKIPEMARYEFPLTGNKKAVLEYPTADMEMDDFDIISMAIELLAKTKKLSLKVQLSKKEAQAPLFTVKDS